MATKAVILAAGYGTRLLPVTRCVPKEMLPLLDRPAIDWVIRELEDAGVTDVLVISSRRKRALEDWFDRDPELEAVFTREGAQAKLAKIEPPRVQASFVRQVEMRGSGQALLLAREFAGSDPVIVAYPDDLFTGPNVSRALVDTWRRTGCSVLSAQRVDDDGELSRYGVLELEGGDAERVRRLVEKPPLGTAPSNLVSFGRYLFTPEFFERLAHHWMSHGEGEYFPAAALTDLGVAGRLVWAPIAGRRLDTGTTLAWLQANIELALADAELRGPMREFLAGLR